MHSPLAYGIILIILITGAAAAGISIRLLTAQLRIWGWLLGLTVLLHLFFTDGSSAGTFLGLTISMDGLYRGIFFGMRFLIFLLSAFLLTITTSPFDLTGGFASLISPLRYIKVPVDDIAMVIAIAFRFIPVIFEEVSSVKTAQEGRGVDFSKKNLLKPTRFIPLLVPMFYSIFRRADDLTEALISRNYTPGAKRTSLQAHNLTVVDISLFMLIVILCSIIAVFA